MDAVTDSDVPHDRIYRGLFRACGGYLDTATYGLPPRVALDAMAASLESWGRGEPTAADYDVVFNEARGLFAELVGVPESDVALGSQTSSLVSVIASSLRPGSEVLMVDGDFSSLCFPFLVAARHGGINVRFTTLDKLADDVRDVTDLVAVSAVQSKDGRVADLEGLAAAATAAGARVLVDATQAVGWLPMDASWFDYTVTSAYKWLLAPRGTAFFTATPAARARQIPSAAGWYAGEDIWSSIYGPSMELASTARRFDVSPAWLAWEGAVPSLQLVRDIGPSAIHRHDVHLANQFRAGMGLLPEDSPIVAIEMHEQCAASLRQRGLRTSIRDGRLRLSFHLYNTLDDVHRAVEAIAGCQCEN